MLSLLFCLYDNVYMVIEKISVNDLSIKVKNRLKEDMAISSEWKNDIEQMLFVIKSMQDRLAKNSRNSSKPPSQDQNRDKRTSDGKKRGRGKGKKPGGQPGHAGATLEQSENPDKVVEISIDQSSLPKGEYKAVGHESRQVYDVEISVVITEYRAEILEDQDGIQYLLNFLKM